MAANTVNATGAITGTTTSADPDFIVEYKTINPQGLVFYVDYTQGTDVGITITFDVLNPSLHATNKYRFTSVNGTAMAALTYVISVTGKYRIPIPVVNGETTIYANISFSGAGLDGVVLANFIES